MREIAKIKVAHLSTVDMSLKLLLLNQLKCLQEEGYEVTGISASGPDVEGLVEAGIRHLAVPFSRRIDPWGDLVCLWKLVRLFRRERFSIVHTHTPKAGLLGQIAGFIARVPIRVHTIHGLYFNSSSSKLVQELCLLLERVTLWPSKMNLSQNPEDVTLAAGRRLCRADSLRFLGNGIDLKRFTPQKASSHLLALRGSLSIPDDALIVGMVARFVREKGYLELLAAAKLILAKTPNVHFLLIGPSEESKADGLNPAIIGEMGLADRVHFLGRREDVQDLYALMDIFVLPSYREGFPRAPMEASAMGVPCIVTDIRGGRQVVEHGKTGFLVPVGDSEHLAARILELIENPELRTKMGAAAREKTLLEFDERHVFEKVIHCYAELRVQMGISP